LVSVQRREDESAEKLLNRFKLMVQRSGILRETKRRRHFISKSESRRIAQARSIRRIRKNAAKAQARVGRGRRPA
jgi:ribosomal protein S21